MTIGNRIRTLRHSLNLTQQEFADRIGIKRNTVGSYEIDRNTPIDAVVSLICREFGVSETWLRNGDGTMFIPEPLPELGDFIRHCGVSELEEKILRAWFAIPDAERQKLLEHFSRYLTGENGKGSAFANGTSSAFANGEGSVFANGGNSMFSGGEGSAFANGGVFSPAQETPEERLKRQKQEAAVEAMEYYQEVLEEKSQAEEYAVSGTSGANIRKRMA